MALEAVQQMRAAYDSSGGLTGLTPVTDEEGEPVYSFQPRQTNGAYDTTNGVYVSVWAVRVSVPQPCI